MAMTRTQNLEKLPREALHVTNKPKTIGHRQKLKEFCEETGHSTQEVDDIEPVQNWGQKYTVDESSYAEDAVGAPDLNGDIIVYTDGSKDEDNYAGARVIIYQNGKKDSVLASHLGDQVSVFQSEVFAIKKAAEILISSNTIKKRIIIHSDSRAAIQAIRGRFIKANIVKDTKARLNQLGASNTVVLRWIKAHVGHEGNERADELAKIGTV